MDNKKFDTIIIGSGPAGYSSALRLAKHGRSVALIEKGSIGGVCLNRGCIPTKVLVAASRKKSQQTELSMWGIISGEAKSESIEFDNNSFRTYQKSVIDRLSKGLLYTLNKAGVEIIRGAAEILDDKYVRVKQENSEITFEYANLIIATGSVPFMLPAWQGIKGVENSESFWQHENIPNEVIIVGGGVIGCEYASSLALLGHKVTIIEKLNTILATEDEDVAGSFLTEIKKRGVKVLVGTEIKNIEQKDDKVSVITEKETHEAGLVIACMGRSRNVNGIGLENIGIDPNAVFQSQQLLIKDNIWIAGDAAFGPQLAHKAYEDAHHIVNSIISSTKPVKHAYDFVPMAVFTTPEISRVGLTEKEAEKRGEIIISKVPWVQIGKAVVEHSTRGFLKMIAEKSSGIILGISIIGPGATELSGYSQLILKNKMTVQQVKSMYFAHPTLGEIFQKAADGFN